MCVSVACYIFAMNREGAWYVAVLPVVSQYFAAGAWLGSLEAIGHPTSELTFWQIGNGNIYH